MSVKKNSLPTWLERGMADLFPLGGNEDPQKCLASRINEYSEKGKPLRVKLGIDPTGSEIHLGHSILFR